MQFPTTVTSMSKRSRFILHEMALWPLRFEMLSQWSDSGYLDHSFWRGNSSQNTQHALSILWSEGMLNQTQYVKQILGVQAKAKTLQASEWKWGEK